MLSLKPLTFSSLLISISLILSHIKFSSIFSFGGSIALCSFVPIILISSKFGYKWGALSGLVFGILHLITTNLKFQGMDLKTIILSVILDYIVTNTIIGFSSYFEFKFKKQKYSLYIGIIVAFILKLIVHIFSGIVVFNSVLKKISLIDIIIYSVVYNSSYVLPELVINILGIYLIKKFIPKFVI